MNTRQMSEEGHSTMARWMKRRIEKSRARCERAELEKGTEANRASRIDLQKETRVDVVTALVDQSAGKAKLR